MMKEDMIRHPVYSGLNKPRLLFGVEYRIILLAGLSGLPILAFTTSRFAMVAAFAVPVIVFAVAGSLYRKDPRFVDVVRAGWGLKRQLDAGKRRVTRSWEAKKSTV